MINPKIFTGNRTVNHLNPQYHLVIDTLPVIGSVMCEEMLETVSFEKPIVLYVSMKQLKLRPEEISRSLFETFCEK